MACLPQRRIGFWRTIAAGGAVVGGLVLGGLVGGGLPRGAAAGGDEAGRDEPVAGPPPRRSRVSQAHEDSMASLGLQRHSGLWRTRQEIEILERTTRADAARREWKGRLERLRRQLDQPPQTAEATAEIRGISDPLAVPALVAAVADDPAPRARALYVEALSRVSAPDAYAALVAIAVDHPDRDTRLEACERLVVIGPHAAVPRIAAVLASADNLQVNRAAEALGRLGVFEAAGPLVLALETEHVMIQGSGPPEGSTSATFTPSGGGLSMGGGPKPTKVWVRNERVLDALVGLTGVNHGWDKAAWRAWLVARSMPPPEWDPRRG
jgi:hypothetical protein